MYTHLGGVRFFSYREYLEEKEVIDEGKGEALYPHELKALVELETENILWRLALREDLPFSGMGDVLRTPAPILFQAAILADVNDRAIRKQKIRSAADRALREANRGRR